MARATDQLASDPQTALEVLAFVLAPAQAFAPRGDAAELEAVRAFMKPMKAEACRRFHRKAARLFQS